MRILDYVWNRRGEVANDPNGPGQNKFSIDGSIYFLISPFVPLNSFFFFFFFFFH